PAGGPSGLADGVYPGSESVAGHQWRQRRCVSDRCKQPQGHQVGQGRPLSMGRGGDPMNALEVTDLSFAYGPREALRHVTFSLLPGRFAALLAPNGAGKSTL